MRVVPPPKEGTCRPALRSLLVSVVSLVSTVPRPTSASPSWHSRPRVRVLHLGDSHLGARPFSAAVRAALVQRFGDGGGGLLLPDLPGGEGEGAGRVVLERGWRVVRGKSAPAGDCDLAGGWAEASGPGALARIEGTFDEARLLFLRQPGGGGATVRLDGFTVERPQLSAPETSVAVVRVRGGGAAAHRVEIETGGWGPVRLLGAVLEGGHPGVSYTPVGVNGAYASSLLKLPEPLLAAQLAAVDPDLVILSYGTNEARAPDLAEATIVEQMAQVVGRVRRAVPRAFVLVVGPPDQGRRRGSGVVPVAARETVSRAFREAARREGALFFDLGEAMGGPGAIRAWSAERPPLVQDDAVHFTAAGYVRLARLFAGGLEVGGPLPDGRPVTQVAAVNTSKAASVARVASTVSASSASSTSSAASAARSTVVSDDGLRIVKGPDGKIHLTNGPAPELASPLLGRVRK